MQRSYSYDSNLVLRTVYLPRELDDRLRTIGFQERQSKNEVIRNLLREALQSRDQKTDSLTIPAEMAVQAR